LSERFAWVKRLLDAEDRAALTEFAVRWGIRLVGGAIAVVWAAGTAGLAVRVFMGAAGWP